MNGLAAGLLVFLALPTLIVVNAIWRGYVLSIIWGWFAVPIFGLPRLTIAPAIGVALVITFLTYHHASSTKTEKAEFPSAFFKIVSHMLFYPALVLAIGWCVKSFL